MSDHETPCRIRIYLIRVVFVQQPPCEHRYSSLSNSTLRPDATIQHSTFKSQHCAPRLRVQKKLFVSFGLFVFIIISCSNSSERPAANKIREIRAIRVQKNIRDIRFITSLRSVGLRRISCSKDLVIEISSRKHSNQGLNQKELTSLLNLKHLIYVQQRRFGTFR